MQLNNRWIAVELIFVIEYWIFRWMLNFPLNGSLLFNIEYSVECWIFRWMDFCYWILNVLLNVEILKVYLLNCRWVNFYHWTLNIPLNVEFECSVWIFIVYWIFVEHWHLSFKVLLLNIEFLLKIGIVPEYWISRYWILKFHWGLDSDWTLNFYHWIQNIE